MDRLEAKKKLLAELMVLVQGDMAGDLKGRYVSKNNLVGMPPPRYKEKPGVAPGLEKGALESYEDVDLEYPEKDFKVDDLDEEELRKLMGS